MTVEPPPHMDPDEEWEVDGATLDDDEYESGVETCVPGFWERMCNAWRVLCGTAVVAEDDHERIGFKPTQKRGG